MINECNFLYNFFLLVFLVFFMAFLLKMAEKVFFLSNQMNNFYN